MNAHVIRSGVSACILEAMTDIEAADALGLPVAAVRRCVQALCKHWQARNRVHLALKLQAIARAPEVAA